MHGVMVSLAPFWWRFRESAAATAVVSTPPAVTCICPFYLGRTCDAVKDRPAFLLQGPAILGMMLLGFVVYVGVMTAFTGVIQGSLADAITEVPTMHAYDDDGNRVSAVSEEVAMAAQPHLERRGELRELAALHMQNADYEALTKTDEEIDAINEELLRMGYRDTDSSIAAMYWWFAYPAAAILVAMTMFSGAGHFWEKGFGIWRRGASLEMFRASIFGLVAIFLVPEVWDVFAIYMTEFARYMMNPGGDPHTVIDSLWCKMGASAACMYDFAGVLDPISWSTALASPNDFGQSLMGEVLMPFFKLMPALVVSLVVFVTAKVRVLFISIVLITLPMWLVLRNVPYLQKHAKNMMDNMVGASFAPFLSAVTLYVGWTHVSNAPMPSLEEWVSVLGIVTLAGLWPLILAPFLSNVTGTIQGAIQTAVVSSSNMAMQIGMGGAVGAAGGAATGGLGGSLRGLATGAGQGAIRGMPAVDKLVKGGSSTDMLAGADNGEEDGPAPGDSLGGFSSEKPAAGAR